MSDWVPFHKQLVKGPKRSLPRAVRFVLMELALEARPKRGRIDLPIDWSTLDAVHDLLGGNRNEIKKALLLFTANPFPDQNPIEIIKNDREHAIVVVNWELYASHTSTARVNAHRENKRLRESETFQPFHDETVKRSTGQDRTGQDKRESAPAHEEPKSGVFPSSPPPPERAAAEHADAPPPLPLPQESERDLGRRTYIELWEKKYKQRWHDPKARLGPESSDEYFRNIGRWAREDGAERAEEFARHYWSSFFRDHGQKGILDELRHPPSWAKDPNRYGYPPKPRQAMPPPKPEPVGVALDPKETQARVDALMGKIGKRAS